LVGSQPQALVEGPSKDTEFVWEARIQGMAPEIDGKVYLQDLIPPESAQPARPGDMVTVEITASHDYDLVGRVITIETSAGARTAAPPSALRVLTGAPLRVLA
jgi:ribosomal protein S12 methylthiotransferase